MLKEVRYVKLLKYEQIPLQMENLYDRSEELYLISRKLHRMIIQFGDFFIKFIFLIMWTFALLFFFSFLHKMVSFFYFYNTQSRISILRNKYNSL